MRLQEIFEKYKGEPKTFIDGMAAEWGGDKGSTHSYIHKYEEWFEPKRNDKINLLEIGVMYGSSLKMWKEYFPQGQIYGMDIRPHCVKYEEDRIKIFINNATERGLTEGLLFRNGLTREFDIIIDDGSHQIDDQLNTFNILFPQLKKGGIYVIEDIQNFDQNKHIWENLGKSYNVEIEDLRWMKNRHDDILIKIVK